jgi:hypothetical protein
VGVVPLPAPRPAEPRDSRVDDLEKRHTAAKSVRRLFEQQWLLNIAYYLGQQWVKVDGAGMLFDVSTQDRVTLTDNRIRPAVRTNIAKMTKTDPTWTGVPRDSSDDEIARARLRQIVFEHYWRELDMRRRVRMWLWWREMTGSGFLKVTWDATRGQGVDVVARGGVVVLDSNGGPITPNRVRQAIPEHMREGLSSKRITFGDAHVALKSPFEIAVDPLATSEGLISAEYLVEEALYSPAYLERVFGVDRDRLREDEKPTPGVLEARFPGLTKYLDSDRGAAGRRGIRVREYWSLPGVDGPRGKHVVWTGRGDVLLEEDSPYPFLPYSMISGPPSGRFYADASLNDLISPQTELNKVESQLAENSERFGNPARIRSAESVREEGDWQGLPGEEIVYHDLGTGQIPSFLVPPEMPGYVQARVGQIQESIRIISGQNEVAQGTVPEGVTAASAISQLMEANDTQIGPDIAELSDGLRDIGKKLLWMVQKFAQNERLARIAGDDGAWDVYTFKGDELGTPDADEVDIGSGLPESKAQKQAAIQFILNLLIQNGQALPPRELRRVLRDYEVGGLEHFYSSVSRDQSQVLDEHRRMLAGEAVGINSWDNDQLHVEEHDDFRKSARFSMLRSRPDGQALMALFEQHVGAHRQRMQEAANAQATAQAAQTAMEKGQPGPDPALAAAAAGGGMMTPSQQGLPSGGAPPSTGG